MSGATRRIWEIDALRGFLILCVIVSHSLFFLSNVQGRFTLPPAVAFVMQYGGLLFVVLSGLSATLGSNSLRRGLMVFAGGMVLTLGSYAGVLLGWLDDGMIIRFGVLHLLGLAMLVYPLLRRLPSPVLLALGLGVVAIGYWLELENVTVSSPILFPLGLRSPGFRSGDYFPLAPHLGWFSLGIVLGRRLYPTRQTLLPGVNAETPVLRFLRWCGQHSLYIFILHLPLVGALLLLL